MNKTITAGAMAEMVSQQNKDIAPLKNLAMSLIAHQTGFKMEHMTRAMAVIHHEAILREDEFLMKPREIEISKDEAKDVVSYCLENYKSYNEKGYRIAVGLQADKALNLELKEEQFDKYDPRKFTFGLNYRHRTSAQQSLWMEHIKELATAE